MPPSDLLEAPENYGTKWEPKPRSIASIIPVGLLLGPATLMLWLGRGRLALLYFVLQFSVMAAFFLPAILGLAPPITLRGFGPVDILGLLQLPLIIIAIIHVARLRHAVSRPWFSRWFIAFPLPVAAALIA